MPFFRTILAIALLLPLLSPPGALAAPWRLEWYPDPDYNETRDRGPRVPDDYDEEDEDEPEPLEEDEREYEQQRRLPAPAPAPQSVAGYRLPSFRSSWGLSRQVYERAQWSMQAFAGKARNRRYVAVIDFSKPSSQRRFFLFDLATGKVERLLVAHGKGSGGNRASAFSNRPRSRQSSLGAYQTLGTDYGKHGLLLRLSGLEGTNSNAFRRAIVMHGARYVSEARGRAGRSWGCPALDKKVAARVMNRIRGGALLVIWR